MINNQNDELDIQDEFHTLTNKTDLSEVLKELFNEGKIWMIGDLTKDEIKLMTRIYMIAEMKNINVWKKGLGVYCKLLLSKDRKSRKEIIDAVSMNRTPRSGFLSKLNPRNWG